MGKGKKSKDKTTAITNEHPASASTVLSTESASPRTAADGRNVEGWSPTDVRTYNELLLERAKLEKEKNELEYKAERRSTERALLNQNGASVDSLFAKQPGGDFKYIGKKSCCLDLTYDSKSVDGSNSHTTRCKHEICSRARKIGISWMEMDTIKYYELRIFTEKSERMKNALRKQREVELVRVKKVEDEEYAAKTRKMALLDKADREALRKSSEASAKTAPGSSASDYQRDAVLEAAKQNDNELSQIRDELEDIRRQVDAGKVTSGDLRSKLDLAQGKMVEAERRNNLFRQMIVEVETVKTKVDAAVATHASLDDDLKKLCATAESAVAQAMTLMKDFFSASGPDQMEETMSRLKSTLEARGPMPKNMRESFKELEAMVAESKAKGLKMDFKVDYGGAVTGNSMVDTMTALRVKMKEGSESRANPGPELKLDKELVQANQGCLRVEEAAEKEMRKESQRLASKTSDALLQSLMKIKDAAVAKSPIPPLSDIMLESKVQGFMDVHLAGVLVRKVEEGTSDQEVAGRLTSLVLAKAQNNPDKFLLAFSAVSTSFDLATRNKVPGQITSQLEKVEKSMHMWVEKHALKKQKTGQVAGASTKLDVSKQTVEQLQQIPETEPAAQLAEDQRLLQREIENLRMDDQNLSDTIQEQPSTDGLRQSLQTFLQKYPDQLEWAFDTFLQNTGRSLSDLSEDTEHYENSRASVNYESKEQLAILNYVSELYDAGCCASIAIIRVTEILDVLSQENPQRVDTDLRLLRGLILGKKPLAFTDRWFTSFGLLAGTVLHLHLVLTSELGGQPEVLAMTPNHASTRATKVVNRVMKVLIHEQNIEASTETTPTTSNLRCIWVYLFFFLQLKMSKSMEQLLAELEKTLIQQGAFCTDKDCRCSRSLQGLINQNAESLVPKPLRIHPTTSSPTKTAELTHTTTKPKRDKKKNVAQQPYVPNMVTTFYRFEESQTVLKYPPQANNPPSKATLTNGTTAVGRSKNAQVYLRAYELAKVEPPQRLAQTVQGSNSTSNAPGLLDVSDELRDATLDPSTSDGSDRDEAQPLAGSPSIGERSLSVGAEPHPRDSKFVEHILDGREEGESIKGTSLMNNSDPITFQTAPAFMAHMPSADQMMIRVELLSRQLEKTIVDLKEAALKLPSHQSCLRLAQGLDDLKHNVLRGAEELAKHSGFDLQD